MHAGTVILSSTPSVKLDSLISPRIAAFPALLHLDAASLPLCMLCGAQACQVGCMGAVQLPSGYVPSSGRVLVLSLSDSAEGLVQLQCPPSHTTGVAREARSCRAQAEVMLCRPCCRCIAFQVWRQSKALRPSCESVFGRVR